jgi:hypothetical protein
MIIGCPCGERGTVKGPRDLKKTQPCDPGGEPFLGVRNGR